MEIKIETWSRDGLRVEGEEPVEPFYDLIDAATGDLVVEKQFASCAEVEAYLAAHHPGCARWVGPPPLAEDAKLVDRVLGWLQNPPFPGFRLDGAMRGMLATQIYRHGYPPQTVATIRRVLGLP